MSNSSSVEVEYGQLISRLIETLRRIRLAPLEDLEDPSRGEIDKLPGRWAQTRSIGKHLMDIGGLDLMHRALRDVRRFSADLCDALEGAWEGHIPGYKKVRWLP